jgi:hypothetical protein
MKNEGTVDRVLWVIVGLGLLSLLMLEQPIVWGWIGLIPLLTGVAGFCPLYKIIGLSTCPLAAQPSEEASD